MILCSAPRGRSREAGLAIAMPFDDEDPWGELGNYLDAEAEAADELALYLQLDPDAGLASPPEPASPTSLATTSTAPSSTEPPPTPPARASDGEPAATST